MHCTCSLVPYIPGTMLFKSSGCLYHHLYLRLISRVFPSEIVHPKLSNYCSLHLPQCNTIVVLNKSSNVVSQTIVFFALSFNVEYCNVSIFRSIVTQYSIVFSEIRLLNLSLVSSTVSRFSFEGKRISKLLRFIVSSHTKEIIIFKVDLWFFKLNHFNSLLLQSIWLLSPFPIDSYTAKNFNMLSSFLVLHF